MGEALFRVLEKKHELTLLQLPHKQLQRSLSFLYHESCISKTLTSTILCFSRSRQSQCLAILKKQEFLGDEQQGPLPIVLMYFKFKNYTCFNVVSVCHGCCINDATSSTTFTLPKTCRQQKKNQTPVPKYYSMLLPWRTLTSTILGM